ncbi:hypothetical protein [Dinoroseobacter sp. S124A]|uniref:hypothetical protein n=1 Tax=Dinoroseobacter sp. S124A TaxID=3415128 RepID=UPI003C7E6E8D
MKNLTNRSELKEVRASGNVFVLIFIAVILFGLLGYTFTKSANKGTGNLTKQQSKLYAQRLISFFNLVDGAFNKLRLKGCSENDISFSNSADTGPFVSDNDSVTAPLDNSCHIFSDNGGKVVFNMNWSDYQVEQSEMPSPNNHGNIYFLQRNGKTLGVGTAANDLMVHLNYVQEDICRAYNDALNLSIDYTVDDTGSVVGDENPDYIGLENFCRYNVSDRRGQIRKTWIAK